MVKNTNNLFSDEALEERADFITETELRNETADSNFFQIIRSKLIERGAKLIVGPRGCGKTHIMRYTWLDCRDKSRLPIAVYVSFTRYYRLEPFLKQQSNALNLFHAWVLGKILLACFDLLRDNPDCDSIFMSRIGCKPGDLKRLAGQLERGVISQESDQAIAAALTIAKVTDVIEELLLQFNRKRAIILLDDAALSLTPDYLVEFFDIFRSLKTAKISPKASVYPGTTEYGPRFHVRHDAEPVEAWLSIENPAYSEVMGQVAERRFKEYEGVPEEIAELLKYAAFGIPRVYLTMLRSYLSLNESTQQQRVNKVIQTQIGQMFAEYLSLKIKLPQFGTIIKSGQTLYKKLIDELTEVNIQLLDKNEKQIVVGIEKDDDAPAYVDRMFRLLVEAGLLYPLPAVAHGTEREYLRYVPHLASLIHSRAFSGRSRGFSARSIVDYLQRKSTKHPLRRKLSTLLDSDVISSLRLDLPPCTKCGAARMSDNQRFCHQCGSELVEESTYKRCMRIRLDEVPGIPPWQKQQIKEKTELLTIGDILTIQDPASELRKGVQIGPVRSRKIYKNVENFVDEFLS